MPFFIIRNDITMMETDAIVNTANPHAAVGSGVDYAIHTAAGPKLLKARKKIGEIPAGRAALTPAYNLPARFVIHTVSPFWQGGQMGEAKLLYSCYTNSLALAAKHRCRSVAFPLLATGNYQFPKKLALEIASTAIQQFLKEFPKEKDMLIYLVVFDVDSYALSEKLFLSVKSYIDEQYAKEKHRQEYAENAPDGTDPLCPDDENRSVAFSDNAPQFTRYRNAPPAPTPASAPAPASTLDQTSAPAPASTLAPTSAPAPASPPALTSTPAPTPPSVKPQVTANHDSTYASAKNRSLRKPPANSPFSSKRSLQELVDAVDETFSQALFRLIDARQLSDPQVYKRANLDRKLFSKIRKNKDYRPSKSTALALAIALELNLDETKDLIGRAGFAITHSSKFDIIVEYCIRENIYNIFELNEILFAFDQPLLGAN